MQIGYTRQLFSIFFSPPNDNLIYATRSDFRPEKNLRVRKFMLQTFLQDNIFQCDVIYANAPAIEKKFQTQRRKLICLNSQELTELIKETGFAINYIQRLLFIVGLAK